MQLRIVSYNVHKCIGGLDRKYRPERIRDAVAPFEPDFALLQEVDDGSVRSGRHRQVDLLGDMLRLPHRAFFPNVRLRDGGHYGNAVLSRYPFTSGENIDVSLPWTKRRSVLHVRARIRKGRHPRTLHLFNLHLGLSQLLRRLQLQRFLNHRSIVNLHRRTPVLLAGDFNDLWGSLGELALGPAGFRGAARPVATFPAWAPFRALDSVYVRGDLELVEIERGSIPVARWASDHLPLAALLRLG